MKNTSEHGGTGAMRELESSRPGTWGYYDQDGAFVRIRFGYINRQGDYVIRPRFDGGHDFCRGAARVAVSGKWRCVNRQGRFIREPDSMDYVTVSSASHFIPGKIWRRVNRAGQVCHVLPWLSPEGLARAYVGGEGEWFKVVGAKWGFADRTGSFVIPPRFDEVQDFREGIAAVAVGGRVNEYGFRYGAKWGYIDSRGRCVARPRFDDASSFSGGLGRVRVGGRHGPESFFRPGGRLIYVNRRGRLITDARFDAAGDFSDGFAVVRVRGRQFYIDHKGREALRMRGRTHLSDFSGGLAGFAKGGKHGFIDTAGKIVIEPRFDYADRFHEGLCPVRLGESMGYIDKTGKMVIEPRFVEARTFSGGLAAVALSVPGHRFVRGCIYYGHRCAPREADTGEC